MMADASAQKADTTAGAPLPNPAGAGTGAGDKPAGRGGRGGAMNSRDSTKGAGSGGGGGGGRGGRGGRGGGGKSDFSFGGRFIVFTMKVPYFESLDPSGLGGYGLCGFVDPRIKLAGNS